MPAYTSHPTHYAALTDDQLYMGFRPSTWEKLTDDTRLNLMQEVVNRSARAHGEIGSCKVIWDLSLSKGTMGEQENGIIRINPDYYSSEACFAPPNMTKGDNCQSWSALETVLHEDEHAFQEQAIDGTIPMEDEVLLKQYRANAFDVVSVECGALGKKPGLQYIRSDIGRDDRDYFAYRLQATERDAHRFSQEKVSAIIERQQALSHSDLGRSSEAAAMDDRAADKFRGYLTANSHENICRQANEAFFTENFEHDLNAALVNSRFGESTTLADPSLQGAIHSAMNQSYQRQQEAIGTHQAETKGHTVDGLETPLGYDWANQSTWPQLEKGHGLSRGGAEETEVIDLRGVPMSKEDFAEYGRYMFCQETMQRPKDEQDVLWGHLRDMRYAAGAGDEEKYKEAREYFLNYDWFCRQAAQEKAADSRSMASREITVEEHRVETTEAPESLHGMDTDRAHEEMSSHPFEGDLQQARAKAVKEAWEREADRVREGKGTWDWTVEQQAEMLSRSHTSNPGVSGFEGSHILSARDYPEHAGNPDNIQLIPTIAHYDGVHERNPRGNTPNGVYHPDTGEVTLITDGRIPELPVFDLTDRYEPDQHEFHDAHPEFEQSGEGRTQGFRETRERHPEKSIGARGIDKENSDDSHKETSDEPSGEKEDSVTDESEATSIESRDLGGSSVEQTPSDTSVSGFRFEAENDSLANDRSDTSGFRFEGTGKSETVERSDERSVFAFDTDRTPAREDHSAEPGFRFSSSGETESADRNETPSFTFDDESEKRTESPDEAPHFNFDGVSESACESMEPSGRSVSADKGPEESQAQGITM